MSLIKTLFESRWGNDGLLISADFSQLEVAVLASLANDETLIWELNNGVDTHRENAVGVFDKPAELIEKSERTYAKRRTFELQFGATAKGMAFNGDGDEDKAQKFIDNYYNKYTGVARAHRRWMREAESQISSHSMSSTIISPFGRRLHFPAIRRRGGLSVSPTKSKNYPVQSGGAEVVSLATSILFREYVLLDKFFINHIKFVNTVHDSIIIDSHKETLDKAIELLYNNLKETNNHVKRVYGVDLGVQIKFDIEVGPTWADMTEINL